MIDHVTKVVPGKSAEGYKNLTNNEWFFPIHFPNNPNVPGVLLVEALAQMMTIAITTLPGNKGKITHFLDLKSSFKKEVVPGDKFEIKTKILSWKRGICNGIGKGYINNELAVESEMTITILEIMEQYLPKK